MIGLAFHGPQVVSLNLDRGVYNFVILNMPDDETVKQAKKMIALADSDIRYLVFVCENITVYRNLVDHDVTFTPKVKIIICDNAIKLKEANIPIYDSEEFDRKNGSSIVIEYTPKKLEQDQFTKDVKKYGSYEVVNFAEAEKKEAEDAYPKITETMFPIAGHLAQFISQIMIEIKDPELKVRWERNLVRFLADLTRKSQWNRTNLVVLAYHPELVPLTKELKGYLTKNGYEDRLGQAYKDVAICKVSRTEATKDAGVQLEDVTWLMDILPVNKGMRFMTPLPRDLQKKRGIFLAALRQKRGPRRRKVEKPPSDPTPQDGEPPKVIQPSV